MPATTSKLFTFRTAPQAYKTDLSGHQPRSRRCRTNFGRWHDQTALAKLVAEVLDCLAIGSATPTLVLPFLPGVWFKCVRPPRSCYSLPWHWCA